VATIVKRTTLIVRDLERALAFYRDVLGFAVWYDDGIVLSGVGLAAGSAGDRTRLVIVKAEDPVIGMIGLLQFTAPELPAPPPRERLGIGDVVFVMQTDDVAGVHARAVAAGARVHAAPHRFDVRGADGTALTMTSLSLWDPDGYFIEINQRHEFNEERG
jgi:catechol 2,3-dioxygenase-like lactoylglutathione lyase family enzyme